VTGEILKCANHPNRDTSLRCNRCNKPICSSCAVLTPVGYRCKECVRGQQAGFNTAKWWDYPITLIIAALGVGLGVALLQYLFVWIGFIFAPVIGGGLAELIRLVVRGRRSQRLPVYAIIGGVVGLVPHLFSAGTSILLAVVGKVDLSLLSNVALNVIWPVGYAILMISTLYYRIRGIRL
jgi:hypothetical protein